VQQGTIIGGGGGGESPDSSSRQQILPQLGPSSSLITIGGRSATPPVEDCTHKTQRCSHAMYAYTSVPPACYTGVPCAAYSNNNKTTGTISSTLNDNIYHTIKRKTSL